MTRSSPPCSAFWKKRSSASPSSPVVGSSASARAPTSCGLDAGSSNTNAPRRGGDPGSAPRSTHDQHDLAELAALLETLVGGDCLFQRVRLVDEDSNGALGKERDHVRLGSPRHQRFVLQGPVTERGARDRRPLLHDAVHVEFGLGPRADADDDDASLVSKGGLVGGQVHGADELEDHVERTAVAEVVMGYDVGGAEPAHAVPGVSVAHRRRDPGAGGRRQLHGRRSHPARGPVYEHPGAEAHLPSGEQSVVGGEKHLGEAASVGPPQAVRHSHRQTLVHDSKLRLGAGPDQGHDRLARVERGHAGPRGHHLARQLHAWDVGRAAGWRRIQALHLHEVGPVQSGGAHSHQELPFGRFGVRVVPDLDVVVDDGDRSHHRNRRRTVRCMRVPLTIGDFLQRADQVYGERIGVVDEPSPPDGSWGSLTWRQVHQRARAQAAGLDRLGVGRGERVAIVSPNAARFLVSFFGISGFGRVMVPINFRLKADEIAYIVEHSGSSVLLVDPELEEALATVDAKHRFVLGSSTDAELFPEGVEPQPWDDPDENDTATINYTSGTTARPKGVQLTHRNNWINAVTFGLHTTTSDRAVYLHTLPMFHANGWGMPYALTGVGARHIALRKVDGAEILRRIDEHGVTLLNGAPAVVNMVLDAAQEWDGEIPGKGRTRMIVAGAPPRTTNMEGGAA